MPHVCAVLGAKAPGIVFEGLRLEAIGILLIMSNFEPAVTMPKRIITFGRGV